MPKGPVRGSSKPHCSSRKLNSETNIKSAYKSTHIWPRNGLTLTNGWEVPPSRRVAVRKPTRFKKVNTSNRFAPLSQLTSSQKKELDKTRTLRMPQVAKAREGSSSKKNDSRRRKTRDSASVHHEVFFIIPLRIGRRSRNLRTHNQSG